MISCILNLIFQVTNTLSKHSNTLSWKDTVLRIKKERCIYTPMSGHGMKPMELKSPSEVCGTVEKKKTDF